MLRYTKRVKVGTFQRILTYFVRGSITVCLTFCLSNQGNLLKISKAAESKQVKQEVSITVPNASPSKVNEYSPVNLKIKQFKLSTYLVHIR